MWGEKITFPIPTETALILAESPFSAISTTSNCLGNVVLHRMFWKIRKTLINYANLFCGSGLNSSINFRISFGTISSVSYALVLPSWKS